MLPKATRVLFSTLFLLSISITIFAQTPTSSEVMRDRISKAKAHLVVKNYSATIYELENIRRETNDRTIHRALNVLLMHAYLEQGDYKRTQKFLNELFKSKKSTAASDYIAVAGQVVSGAKTQSKRYAVMGLDTSDEKLPSYAVEDLNQMRKTLELIIGHSKVIGKNKKVSSNSFALLEETSAARSNIARDDYDAKRWQNEVTYARQQIASSGSRIINAVDDSPINAPDTNIVAINNSIPDAKIDDREPVEKPFVKTPEEKKLAPSKPAADKIPENTVAKTDVEKTTKPLSNSPQPTDRKIRVIGSARKSDKLVVRDQDSHKESKKNKSTPARNRSPRPPVNNGASNDDSPISVGSLIGYATKRVNPVYPRQARSMRMTGVVTIKLTVDEDGKVAKVENAEGPTLLKRAAQAAARKWQFRPFTRDGQPVRATGFVSFNFNL